MDKTRKSNIGNVQKGRMDLYLKAGPDGTSVGDCPFAHYVRMVMAIKNLNCELHPCSPDGKPDWLMADHEGKMPCLDYDGVRMTDSSAIAEYVEKTFPVPPLSFPEENSPEKKAMEATSRIFPALAKVLKSLEPDFYAEKTLMQELTAFNSFLEQRSREGKYLLGDQLSLADCSLAPKLYHLDKAMAHFFPDTHKKIQNIPKVAEYMSTMFSEDCFKNTAYPPEVVIWGWQTVRDKISKKEEVTCEV